jgi:hypothetical protein
VVTGRRSPRRPQVAHPSFFVDPREEQQPDLAIPKLGSTSREDDPDRTALVNHDGFLSRRVLAMVSSNDLVGRAHELGKKLASLGA